MKRPCFYSAIFTAALCLIVRTALPLPSGAQTVEGPSFSCAHVTSQINQLICTTPRLAALDRELSLVFNNMQGQPLDRKALRAEEDAWLAALHRDCSDIPCIEQRYKARLRMLRDISLRAASPATYDQTRPFAVPDAVHLEAEAALRRSCTTRAGLTEASILGFGQPATAFPPVFGDGFVVVVREIRSSRFAFLLASTSTADQCLVLDEVALPANVKPSRFLQCSNIDPPLSGFGVRSESTNRLLAFWTASGEPPHIERVPIEVMGIAKSIRCHQPEGPE